MSAMHPLDRPVWNCLNGPQSELSTGREAAVRIDSRYGPFAAARDDRVESQAALADLLGAEGDEIWIVETTAWPAPPGTYVKRQAELLQMVAEDPQEVQPADRDPLPLSEGDAAEMTALALATEPGPWGEWTRKYGQFYGYRHEGALQAMAGERMRPAPGFAEVSAVCTWPEWQGMGLAGQLIRKVMSGMVMRGDTPFLHSYASNAKAIRLYESLGFRARRNMVVTILGKD